MQKIPTEAEVSLKAKALRLDEAARCELEQPLISGRSRLAVPVYFGTMILMFINFYWPSWSLTVSIALTALSIAVVALLLETFTLRRQLNALIRLHHLGSKN